MANWILDWAIKLKLEPTPKLVLIILANRANKDSMACYPSLFTIMQETCLSKSAVTNSMLKLVGLGLLKRTPQFNRSGGRTSTLSHLLVPEEAYLLYLKKTGQVDTRDKGSPGKNTTVVSKEDREPLRRTESEPKSSDLRSEAERSCDPTEPRIEALEIWRDAKAFLQTAMDPQHFLTWVGPIELISVVQLEQGRSRWSFFVPNVHFQQWWLRHAEVILDAAKHAGFTEEIVCEFKQRLNN